MTADEIPGLGAATRREQDPVIRRAAIYFAFAGIEGASAAAVVMLVAMVYHLGILGQEPWDFGYFFYGAFSGLAGLVYAIFSSVACGRFLDGDRRLQSQVPSSLYGWTAAIAITLLTAFLIGKVADLSRVTLTAAYLVGVPLMPAVRSYVQSLVADRIRKGELHFEKVGVIGNRVDVVNFLLHGELWRRGHKLSGTFYLEDVRDEEPEGRRRAVAEFARICVQRGTDHIVIVGDLDDFDELQHTLDDMKRFALNVIYAPATSNVSLKFLDVVPIGPNNALRFMRKPMSDAEVVLKRAMDLVGSGVGLLLLSPFLALVAIAIVLDTPGPVIYRQARRGFNGETFMMWKFRSMTVTEDGHAMSGQAQVNDRRITRVGKILRASSIDELPQLVNVLLGQMSLVGPRPHAVSHDEELSKRLETYAHRQRIKPGITGWAQVNGFRGETATAEALEGRVLHDIYYIDNWSIFLDVWTLVLTFVSPAARRNAR